ncbi:hypothetical protein K502DRAFT_297129 [Neoconidiobolus thromboides FSU 785]|nr:hypothetical protein K502DRAFT_297129 [Neoconidiobolus thromboides FSU 785]
MNWKDYCLLPLTFFPPVFLGLILNFLNAVSYGMIIFPTQIPIFKDFGPDGVAMFLVSTAISQFVYSGFGSGFPCAAGGFMLEVVPFLHIIVNTIIEDIGIENEKSVVATTMIAYALSSIVTGIVFFLLGYFKLGNLVGFFPRHILVGCIGGVGYFLCQTALEVVSGVKLNYFELECWVKFFEPKAIALWGTSICLAVTLKLLQRRINSPILLPFFYMMVPVIFFTIVNLFQLDVEHLRQIGWLFPIPDTSKPFYNFYLHFDFYNTSWSTLPKLVPIMLALTFFGILHVPINVPAVAVTTKTDVYDVNEELIGHGWSNSISGLFGSLQNYLMYSSSVLFFKSGGNDRFAGMMLAIATTLIWTAGPGAVAFIPCIVLGSVIFHLGMELFKEGVYETYGVMTTLEYITIWIIVIAMALLGFVEGVFVGIALACLFFVYLYSQRTPIRSSYSGRAAKSTVRRVYKQRQFLDQASTLIHVIKLQGFMFFGTIDSVEATIRDLISDRQWSQKPLSFLILDLTLVTGVDFSAAEAFIRIRRLLTGKKVFMILCGVTPESDVGMALHAVGIWEIQDGLSQTFETLNNALEWCENKLLEAAYMRHSNSTAPAIDVSNNQLSNSMLPLAMSNSPRTAHLDLVRKETLVTDNGISAHFQQPLALLVQMFSEAQPTIDEAIFKLVPYFKHALKNRGETLWNDGDPADCFYILETGLLKVYTKLENGKNKMIESILPGAMVGELALFTNLPRPYTVITDDHCSLWCLDRDAFDSLSKDEPAVLIRFMQLALAYSVQEMNIYTLNVMAL